MEKLAIGKMAQICNVSIQTLRYYDRINLIKPQYRNPENGYRYYDISQVFRINIIKYLQYSGLSIEEIRAVWKLNSIDLQNFWKRQELRIDQQIADLNKTKNLAKGQQKQLSDLLTLEQYPLNQVYQRSIPQQVVLKLPMANKITPLDYPDAETGQLDKLLIENGTVGNLQYGFSFPMKNYQNLTTINYTGMFTQIFTKDVGQAEKYLSVLPAGDYLCISFYWDRTKYFQFYQQLYRAFLKECGQQRTEVYEISSIDRYQYDSEHSFRTELRIRIK